MEELQLCWLVQAGVTSHCLPLLLRRPWIACQPTSIIACSLLKVIIIIATVLCWINDRLYCDVAGIVQVNYVSNKHWFLRYFRLTVVCLACFPQICLSSCWDNDKKLKRSQGKNTACVGWSLWHVLRMPCVGTAVTDPPARQTAIIFACWLVKGNYIMPFTYWSN